MRSKSAAFPTLWTERLVLRAPASNDAEPFRALLSIPEVTRYSNWPDAPSKAQGERYMRWMSKLHATGKGCAWIIEERESSGFVGAIRFNTIDKKWRGAEIGYESHPAGWGKGLMTEAASAVTAWGHGTLKLNRIEAWTLPGNGASDRVLEKVGFRHEGVQRQKAWFKGGYHDFRLFGRIAADPIP